MASKQGVRRRSRQEWAGLIEVQGSSGLSVATYCRRERLNVGTFLWWRRRLRRLERVEPASPRAAFVPLSMVAPGPSLASEGAAVELIFGGPERRVRLSSDCPTKLAAAVIAAVSRVPSCS